MNYLALAGFVALFAVTVYVLFMLINLLIADYNEKNHQDVVIGLFSLTLVSSMLYGLVSFFVEIGRKYL